MGSETVVDHHVFSCLTVEAVQSSLEEISLSWVLRIEELQHLHYEGLIHELLRKRRLKIGRFEEPQKELIHKLEVWPGSLKRGFVLFRVKISSTWVFWRWKCPKQIDCKHVNNFWVNRLGDDLQVTRRQPQPLQKQAKGEHVKINEAAHLSIVRHVVNEFVESSTLDFLRLELTDSLGEIEERVALAYFLNKQLRLVLHVPNH